VAHAKRIRRGQMEQPNTGGAEGQKAADKTKYCCCSGRGTWWESEPRLGRVAHGVARRVDRLKAIGNGQVPQVAALAWRILHQRLIDCP
jgi:DNA (cytosine-5)-methyltransferase 1